MNRFVITAALAAGAGAAALGLSAGHTTTAHAVALTGTDATMADVLATMTSANDQIETLATHQIWGEKVFEHQQTIQDSWTAALNQLQGLQDQPFNGVGPIADDPAVLHANDNLNTALTNLVGVENSMPMIATSGTDTTTQLTQVPELLFDQAKMFTIDYTQVAPAALGDVFTSATAGIDEVGDDIGHALSGLELPPL